MKISTLLIALVTFILCSTLSFGTVLGVVPKQPFFPASYSMKVYIEATRKFSYDVFYDYDTKQYRIDSYGVPMSTLVSESPLFAPLVRRDPKLKEMLLFGEEKSTKRHGTSGNSGSSRNSEQSSSTTAEASKTSGATTLLDMKKKSTTQALYSFIFDYESLLLYSLFPGTCIISKLHEMDNFPSMSSQQEDLLGGSTYMGQHVMETGEIADHYVRNYVFTQIDYFQAVPNSNSSVPHPKKLVVADVAYFFSNVVIDSPDPNVFIPPPDCSFYHK